MYLPSLLSFLVFVLFGTPFLHFFSFFFLVYTYICMCIKTFLFCTERLFQSSFGFSSCSDYE